MHVNLKLTIITDFSTYVGWPIWLKSARLCCVWCVDNRWNYRQQFIQSVGYAFIMPAVLNYYYYEFMIITQLGTRHASISMKQWISGAVRPSDKAFQLPSLPSPKHSLPDHVQTNINHLSYLENLRALCCPWLHQSLPSISTFCALLRSVRLSAKWLHHLCTNAAFFVQFQQS